MVEGDVELPRIEEDDPDYAFITVEGWHVRDPSRGQSIAAADARAQRLGIQGLVGGGGHSARQRQSTCSHDVELSNLALAKLACLRSADIPLPPLIEELEEPTGDEQASVHVEAAAPHQRNALVKERSTVRRRKRGGRRSRGDGRDSEETVSVWSFNSSGAPQLRAAVGLANVLGRRGPVAILSQEHHASDKQVADLQAQLKKSGWGCAAALAVCIAAGGRSSGVAVCTPVHVEAGIGPQKRVECSPAGSARRIASLLI